MIFQTISLILLAGYLIWVLYSKITADSQRIGISQKVRVVSQKTGQVFDIQLMSDKGGEKQPSMTDDSFLTMARILFQKTTESFVMAQKNDLKQLVDSNVYSTFEKEINLRQEKKHHLDFCLIGVISSKIIEKADSYKTVAVEFISEQVNVLKDENDNVIEGDAMHVAQIRDIWTFKKEGKMNWIVSSTKSEPYNAQNN